MEEELSELISKNMYIRTVKSNKKKDINSLSYLVDMQISQSDCIKLGIGLEKILTDIILKYTLLSNIKEKDQKGAKQKDHLFADHENKIIYYAELKANINLDTEKSKSTCDKCLAIADELAKEFPHYTIKWCLLGYRYITTSDVPITLKNKYTAHISDHLYGINDYFKSLNVPIQFDNEEQYKLFINRIANAMFSK
jgi:hypothetical protein